MGLIESLKLLFKIFDTKYCQSVSDRLWKRRISWVKKQCSIIPKGSLVLDVGAGTCMYKDNLKHCKYIAQDFVKTPGVKYGKIDIVSDITDIPLGDMSIDTILCTEVLEHVSDPNKALEEMNRLLKIGGRLILTSPLGSGQHQKPYHYYGGFTRFWYEEFLPNLGFEIYSLEPCGGLFGHTAELLWRSNGVVELIKHKGLPGNILSKFIQVFIYNIPTVFLWELEKRKIIEDFTTNFLCIAIKKI